MSTHFQNTGKTEKESTLRWLFSPNRPRTAGEIRFQKHAYYRSAVCILMMLYFVYCNPEYSYTYSYIRRQKGWTDDTPALFPQYLKMVPQPGGAAAEVAQASQTTPLDAVDATGRSIK